MPRDASALPDAPGSPACNGHRFHLKRLRLRCFFGCRIPWPAIITEWGHLWFDVGCQGKRLSQSHVSMWGRRRIKEPIRENVGQPFWLKLSAASRVSCDRWCRNVGLARARLWPCGWATQQRIELSALWNGRQVVYIYIYIHTQRYWC